MKNSMHMAIPKRLYKTVKRAHAAGQMCIFCMYTGPLKQSQEHVTDNAVCG